MKVHVFKKRILFGLAHPHAIKPKFDSQLLGEAESLVEIRNHKSNLSSQADPIFSAGHFFPNQPETRG